MYFAEFQMLVSKLNRGEEAKLDALKEGVSIELRRQLLGRANGLNFDKFVALCQQLDSEIRALQHYEGRNGNSSHQQPRATQNLPRTHPPAPTYTAVTGGLEPMDLSASGAGRGKISEVDPPDHPLQWTLLEPEFHEEQLVRQIASDLGREIEISPRGSLLHFLSRFERPFHVEVSGKKQSEVGSAVGMATGTLPVKKIFNGMYYEYLCTLYSNANKYTSCERGIGTSRP